MKHSKSLAIIGASGMVGADLTRHLKPYFQTIIAISRKNYNHYRGHKFDIVINANGNSNKIWANNNILDDFEASTVSVYKTLSDFTFKTYIYISSSDVYENHTSENYTSESQSINPEKLTHYGFHKFLSESIIKNMVKSHIILRCPMILGTHLKKGPIYDSLNNSRLFISKESSFQMITTKELARVIYFLLNKGIKKDTFNVGGKNTVSFSEISKYIDKEINFSVDGTKQTYKTDVSKLNRIYPLKTSSEYLKDFLKNYIIR